jgi:protein arginine kinase activator
MGGNGRKAYVRRPPPCERLKKDGFTVQCQICNKKTATIHLTEITDGARTEMHLCEQCAVQQGIAAKSQVSVNELLSGLLASQPSEEELFGPGEGQKTCPHCGSTLGHFRKEGVLGCPHDYEIFEEALMPLIERVHNGKTRHGGKVPSRLALHTKVAVECSRLRQHLQAAIRKEDYEVAAQLRDQINQLEKGGGS